MYTLDDLLFPVKKVETESLGLKSIGSTEFSIVGTINGRRTLLNSCSNVYELVANSEIFPVIEDKLRNAGIKFTAKYRMNEFTRFEVDYILWVDPVVLPNGDKIYPVLKVKHSYNGLLKYKLTFGYYRVICSNGLVVPVEGKENFTVTGKHTAKILESLLHLEEQLNNFLTRQEEYAQNFRVMGDNWIENWNDRLLDVIIVSGVGKRGYQQITDKIAQESDKLYKGEVNDWLLYNGVNFHLFNARTKPTEDFPLGKEYATENHLREANDKTVFETLLNNDEKQLRRMAKKVDPQEKMRLAIVGGESED